MENDNHQHHKQEKKTIIIIMHYVTVPIIELCDKKTFVKYASLSFYSMGQPHIIIKTIKKNCTELRDNDFNFCPVC